MVRRRTSSSSVAVRIPLAGITPLQERHDRFHPSCRRDSRDRNGDMGLLSRDGVARALATRAIVRPVLAFTV
jgi:hypothetical protein